MFNQVGLLQTDGEGIARKGLILRHLVLPGEIENSKKVLRIISGSPFKDTHLSLMSQYFPAYKAVREPGIDRRLYPGEYEDVKAYAMALGFAAGWFQDMEAPGGA
jgi:putative pyruvate formate lyase activating enzyme